MQRICEYCSEPFEAKRSDAKTCSQEHRNKLKQKVKRLSAVPAAELDKVAEAIDWPEKADHPAAGLRVAGELLLSVRQSLEKAGRLDTPHGQLALTVAKRLDTYSLLEPGAGLSSLSKELDRLLGVALAGTQVESDELDELQARRRAKAAQA